MEWREVFTLRETHNKKISLSLFTSPLGKSVIARTFCILVR